MLKHWIKNWLGIYKIYDAIDRVRLDLSIFNAEMNKKPWVDPDDVPELTKEWFENAHQYKGGKLVKKGKGKLPPIKRKTTAKKK